MFGGHSLTRFLKIKIPSPYRQLSLVVDLPPDSFMLMFKTPIMSVFVSILVSTRGLRKNARSIWIYARELGSIPRQRMASCPQGCFLFLFQ